MDIEILNISVLIPTYNRAELLERALYSLVNQSYREFQTVIVDNASSDHTSEVVARFQDSLSIVYLRSDHNLGAVQNWLKGLNLIKTEWVKILWSDDWLEKDAISELINFVTLNNLDVGVCGAFGHLSTGVYNWVGEPFIGCKWAELVPRMVKSELTASATCALIRTVDAIDGLKSKILDQHAYETAIGPDLLMLYWSVIKGGNAGYLDKPLVNMFASPDSISIEFGSKIRPLYAHAILMATEFAKCQIEPKDEKILNHWIKEGIIFNRIPRLEKTPGKLYWKLVLNYWPKRFYRRFF